MRVNWSAVKTVGIGGAAGAGTAEAAAVRAAIRTAAAMAAMNVVRDICDLLGSRCGVPYNRRTGASLRRQTSISVFPESEAALLAMESAASRRISRGRIRNRGQVVMAGTNLAARAGRWSASHWKTAAFGWIAFAVLAVFVGGAVGAREMKDWAIANGESRRAEQILAEGNFKIPARESVLIQSETATAGQPAFAAAVASVVQTLSGEPDVLNIVSPIDHPNAGLVSRDGHSALVQFDVKGKAEDANDKIAPI